MTPLESGLKWTVKFKKEDFVGKEALQESAPRYLNLKLMLEKGVPRNGYPVENENGEQIGHVTSGSMSVVLNQGVAMARVEKQKYNRESKLFVNIRNKKYPAVKKSGPFVTGGHK